MKIPLSLLPPLTKGRVRTKRFDNGYIRYRKVIDKEGNFAIQVTENNRACITLYKFQARPRILCIDHDKTDGDWFNLRYTGADVRNYKVKLS